jgi:hypothetical protein
MNPPWAEDAMIQLRPNLGKTRHHLIVGAIDTVLVVKRHWQADDGRLGSIPEGA